MIYERLKYYQILCVYVTFTLVCHDSLLGSIAWNSLERLKKMVQQIKDTDTAVNEELLKSFLGKDKFVEECTEKRK